MSIDLAKKIGIGIVGFLLIWLFLGMFGIVNTKFFGVMTQDAKRQVFEQTKSYNHGTIQDMYRYKLEYVQASPEHQAALRDVVNSTLGGFDRNKLPVDLRVWVAEINSSKGHYD